jgi:uncharacterized protein (TIGR02001 family)
MKRILFNAGSMVLAATAAAAATGVGAVAQDELTIEGNVALVSDYRFRGVSLSDETVAIQGGFDLALPSGLYAGTWASSIENYGGSEIELDLYGGYGFEAGMFALDVGVLGYFYPGADDLEYYEIYGSVGTTLGMIDTTLGLNYAPSDQDGLGDDENTYVYLSGGMPLGDSPFSLSASVGYTDGVLDFSDDGDGFWDWSVGISTSVLGVDVGLSYVDTSGDGDGIDATAVLSFSKAL